MLAAALLLFGWSSVAIAADRRAASAVLLAMPGGQDSRTGAAAWIRAAAGLLAGVCAVLIAAAAVDASPFGSASDDGISGWIVLAYIAAATAAGIAALVTLELMARLLVSRFPAFADRVSAPLYRLNRPPTARAAPQNGIPGNGSGTNPDGEPPPSPLTAAEILNLDPADINMVRSISRMDNRDAADIMVPRLDVDAVAASASLDEVVGAFVASRHTRLPVYREKMDDVVGIIHISDVLLAQSGADPAVSPERIMREPEFVAENMKVDDLLALLRRKSLQMAIVVDEFGGVEGIVTLEDVLEEIVGEITDEFTKADSVEMVVNSDGSWTLNATLRLDDLYRDEGIVLEHGDVNTVGGFVYTKLGRMPAVGDLVYADSATIEVTQPDGNRIQQMDVLPPSFLAELVVTQLDGRRIQQVCLRVADDAGASDGDCDSNGNSDTAAHRKRAAK